MSIRRKEDITSFVSNIPEYEAFYLDTSFKEGPDRQGIKEQIAPQGRVTPGAKGKNKAGRGSECTDKGHNPMVSEKEEENWSSDVSPNSSMITTQICNKEVGPRTSQEVRSARQGWDRQRTRLNPGTATAQLRQGSKPRAQA